MTESEKKIEGKTAIDWFNEGRALYKYLDYDEAVKSFDKALELNPKNGRAWYFKGIALSHLDNYEEANKCLDKALELKPGDNLELILKKKKEITNKLKEQKEIEEASIAIKDSGLLFEKAESAGLFPDKSMLQKARDCFKAKKYRETIKLCSNFIQKVKAPKPSISLNLSTTIFNLNTGRRTKLNLKNEGSMDARNVGLKFSGDVDIRTPSLVKLLKSGDTQSVDVWIRPKSKGETPLDVTLKYADVLERSYEETKELWISTEETILPTDEIALIDRKIGEEKLSKPQAKVAPTIAASSYLSLERAIYDPIKRNFIISARRPLPNVKNWIEKNDSSMYWLIICINNNSDKSIDEWGIELETPATLKILDARIEGIEHAFKVRESFSKAWLTNWILGVPHHLGIVIPRKGSKRIYFKLGSDACGVSYSIKGKVSTSDSEVPIKEKHFKYSCDTATLKVAIRTNPEEAEKYAQTVLSNAYSKDTALKLLQSFRIVQEIDRCCARGDYGEIKDKLQMLLDALESAKVGERLIRMAKDNLESVSILGEADASAQRAGRLCGNLVDAWINEVLRT